MQGELKAFCCADNFAELEKGFFLIKINSDPLLVNRHFCSVSPVNQSEPRRINVTDYNASIQVAEHKCLSSA